MFLDSDDRWLPGHVDRLLAALDGRAAAYGVTRNLDTISGESFLVPEGEGPECGSLAALGRWCAVMTSAVAVRRAALAAVGGFPGDMGALGEDWGLYLKLAGLGDFGFVPSPPVSERLLHPGSVCARVGRAELLNMYRKLLVIAAESGENEEVFLGMRRVAAWLDETEEDGCLSVQQWYGRMRDAGVIA
jgi:hypothetical protein